MLKRIALALALLFQIAPATAWIHGAPGGVQTLARSQFGPNFATSTTQEWPFLNLFKTNGGWSYSNGGSVKPPEADSNGYLLSGANWTTQGGGLTRYSIPMQSENPGNHVLIWLGQGKFSLTPDNFFFSNAVVSCTGTGTNPGSVPTCDNTACSTFTGSISGTTLTVTAAPTGTGCTLGPGVPVSGQISTFDTMTVITSAGSACGGNTCYTVNQSQTLGSGTMVMGGRFEISFTAAVSYSSNGGYFQRMRLIQLATGSGSQRVTRIAALSVNDESTYWTSATPCGSGKACIVGPIFKTRAQQGNFAVMRDLNWGPGNVGSCSTWGSRKPTSYFTWNTSEIRNAASGNETYTVQGNVYTIPKVGQYVDAGGTGASAGTVSYNGGTDVYSVTLGSGAPVDKQTIIMLVPTAGTSTSKISLNGTTSVPILNKAGGPLGNVGTSFPPTLTGEVATFFYDATLNGFLYYSSGNATGVVGIDCSVPPEVSMEIAGELGMALWHDPPYFGLDPMTDWMTQHATYQKANYPFGNLFRRGLLGPIYEASNEPFNCPQINANYMGYKSAKYVAADPSAWNVGLFCGGSGNNYGWVGKVTSTMGQDLVSVYGAGNFELAPPIQTTFPPGGNLYPALTSVQYVSQTLIPAQSGYTQTQAYRYATRISINNYWNVGFYTDTASTTLGFRGLEAGVSYCYYYYSVSAACQSQYASQAAAMTAYMNSATASTCAGVSCSSNSIFNRLNFFAAWNTQALVCFTASTRPGTCTVNATSPIFMYEGTYSPDIRSTDIAQTSASATNANPAVLTIANNGCVAGQTVALSSLSGGTWASAAGSYTVQASGTDASHCAINLDSTALGTLSGATLTYTGSATYITFMRQASYMAPELSTLTQTYYTGVLANGGQNPSQFNLTDYGALFGSPWLVWGSLYSGIPMGVCTSCTIASTTLTLGGTITGMFRTGDVLIGANQGTSQYVTGKGAGSASNTTLGACTPAGANVCGTTAGDTFALSQASTVSTGFKMQSVSPIPSTAWDGIRAWNGNP